MPSGSGVFQRRSFTAYPQLKGAMAHLKIRHFEDVFKQKARPFVFFKGEPPTFLRPGSFRLDSDGYWLSQGHIKWLSEQRVLREREERRAKRLKEAPRFGKGSGRAGGGRGAVHARDKHNENVTNDIKPSDCTICYHRRLWTLFLASDYGRWTDVWEAWPEEQLLRMSLARMDRKERRHLMSNPLELHNFKQNLPAQFPDDFRALKDQLGRAGIVFDQYMRTHRFEHKREFCVFVHFGIQFVYDRASIIDVKVPAEPHSEPEEEIRWDLVIDQGVITHEERLPTENGSDSETDLPHLKPGQEDVRHEGNYLR